MGEEEKRDRGDIKERKGKKRERGGGRERDLK